MVMIRGRSRSAAKCAYTPRRPVRHTFLCGEEYRRYGNQLRLNRLRHGKRVRSRGCDWDAFSAMAWPVLAQDESQARYPRLW
jgi:hypothetical protein